MATAIGQPGNRTCLPTASNSFSTADNGKNMNFAVELAQTNHGIRRGTPRVNKTSSDGAIVYGKLVVWDNGAGRATVATKGIQTFTAKTALTNQSTNAGNGIVGEGGGADAGLVKPAATGGTGKIVGWSSDGLTLYVDLG